MRKPVLFAVIGTVGLLCAGAVAGYVAWRNPGYAEVVRVNPVKQTVSAPEKICNGALAAQRTPIEDQSDHASSPSGLSGRVISGMGLPVGTGSAGKVFSASGASARAPGVNDEHGTRAQKNNLEKTHAAAITRCRTVMRASERVVAYDVHYRLHGRTSKIRMDHDPGPRIAVKDGKLVLKEASEDGSGFSG